MWMSWFNDRYYELWICIGTSCTAASVHLWCIPVSATAHWLLFFFFLHACLRFCHVQAHVFHSVLGYHTGPHLIEHTFIVLTCAHFGVMCAVALLLMCIQIVLISVSWFSAGPGPKKVQVPLISTDKACSLDCSLFFFLCIINQYSHNKPLTHKKTVLSCLTDDSEYFAPLIKPSLYWIYTFLPAGQT